MTQSVYELLEALSPLEPFRTFEDIPISLALYPVLHYDGSYLRIVDDDTNRAGKRWGMSSLWDGTAEHYMIPEESLFAARPLSGHYITAAQVFDYTYDIERLFTTLGEHKRVKKAFKDESLWIEESVPKPSTMWTIFDQFARIMEMPHPTYRHRMSNLLNGLMLSCVQPYLHCYYLYQDTRLLGFALMWVYGDTCFHTHRFVIPEERNLTRFFDLIIATHVWFHYGCTRLNIGDALGLPGVAQYKLDMGPKRLVPYFNVLSRQERLDHVQPRDT